MYLEAPGSRCTSLHDAEGEMRDPSALDHLRALQVDRASPLGWGRATRHRPREGRVPGFLAMTADGQGSQLCTTGDLTWTAKRVAQQRGISTGPRALRPGTLRIRVDGAWETVKLG